MLRTTGSTAAVLGALLLTLAGEARAQSPFRKIGEMEVAVRGISAVLEPAAPVVPRNIPSGVRVVVRAGDRELSVDEVKSFLGLGAGESFQVAAELSGPGLGQTITLPAAGAVTTDPLLIPYPGLAVAGDYHLSGARITVGGQPRLDVTPDDLTIRVIDQILVTSVRTRPLTLDEIRARGIVLDDDDYLGFEFTLGLRLESDPISINFPVVFDRRGVPLPQPLVPPPSIPRTSASVPPPLLVPMLLERTAGPGDDDPSDDPPLTLPNGAPIRIPALLVIPGEVGYLKQFFSAQLFVANGAPVGSGLMLQHVAGTLKLPAGADGVVGTEDDPLQLPELPNGTQPLTMPVRAVGPDGEPGTGDDVDALAPGDQGMADFTVRAENEEGFHAIGFDIDAELTGLPTGPVHVTGQARGGILVRNPYLSMTFAVPSVVRADEEFDLFVTISNVGQVPANLVHMEFIEPQLSTLTLLSSDFEVIPSLAPRTSRTFRYRFLSHATGQVVASYLKFEIPGSNVPPGSPVPSGTLRFTMGVGERGVALSPDTLVLPSAVDALPADVVRAAMRVLGQAWSVARATSLPPDVLPIDPQVVRDRALSLAEAGLRRRLGQPELSTLRDYAYDLHTTTPRDRGFDQLLRQTEAGRALDAVLGQRLASGGADAVVFERAAAGIAASGTDFLSFAVGGAAGLPAQVVLRDGAGRVMVSGNQSPQDVLGAMLLSLGAGEDAPVLGLVGTPLESRYTIEVLGRDADTFAVSVTLPRGDGTFVHAEAYGVPLAAGSRSRLRLDLASPLALVVETDVDGDGVFEAQHPLSVQTLDVRGPQLVAASVIGPETLSGATPFGYMAAFLFDRPVDPASAAVPEKYEVPANRVEFAKAFLSGRIVLALLDQPEGPYVPTTVEASGVADARGNEGPAWAVDLSSQLEEPGAIVTGRVLEASGAPVPSVPVTYGNVVCDPATGIAVPRGISVVATDPSGFYQVRYVRQDPCGNPFRMDARDPVSGALRGANGWVRAAGELINLDLVFLGYGHVTGTVRHLSGAAAPGAAVRVVSVTDPQVGAVTTADAQGRYAVSGITVGSVVVDASAGLLLGHSAGSIPIAGGTAQVDVTLDGTATVTGTVFRVPVGGQPTRVAGAQVVFTHVEGTNGTVTGVTSSDGNGRYRFEGMPAGGFDVRASVSLSEWGALGGVLVPGQTIANHDITIVVPAPDARGTIQGAVLSATGEPVASAYVNVGSLGALTDGAGAYRIEGLPVVPFQFQTVHARSADGLRFGSAQFQINAPGQTVAGVNISLSGLGSVEFTVQDALGAPVANQEVRLAAICLNPCGCEPRVTDAQGRVRWDGRPMGAVSARAVRPYDGYIDVATGQATLTQHGQVATAVLRFAGVGRVQGIVFEPGGTVPAHGADVTVIGRKYFNDGEQVCGMLPDQVVGVTRTDQQGRFEVPNVAVGGFKVLAHSFVYPTPVGTQGAITAHGGQASVSLTLTDTLAGRLTGRVLLPDGQTPVGAGVPVTLNGPLPEVEVRTVADGTYAFPKILPAGFYTAVVRDAATGGVVEARIYLPASLDAVHDFRLKSRGPVVVRVVTGSNQPAASGTVKLTELEYPRRTLVATVQEGGLASFPGIYEGPVVAEASTVFAEGGRASAIRPAGTDPFEIKVTLGATGTVRGRFVMPDGITPIPFGVVRLIASGQVVGQVTTAGSGDVGSFEFQHVPAGSVRLDAQDPLTARTGVAGGDLHLDQVLELTVRAQGLGRVQGLVTGNGEPAGGATVEVRSGSYLAATSTDLAGRYVIEGVPEGQVVSTASFANGFLRGSNSGLLSGDGQTLTLDVPLQDTGSLAGVLLKAGGTEPAPLSTVSVSAGAYQRTTVSAADGTFGFAPVPAGGVNLAAAVVGGIDRARGTADVPVNGPAEVVLTLNGVGALTGETRSTGGPISGRLILSGTGAFTWQKVIYTPADGQFALPELLAGPFTAQLQATVGGFPLYGSATGEIVPGGTANLVISVQPSGTVVGRVLRADGTTPAVGASVVVQAQNGAAATLSAGPDGTFSAPGVPVGTASIRVQDQTTGGVARADGIVVTEGATTDAGTLVLDDSPVAVVSVLPADGTAGVALGQVVSVTFSDPLASVSGVSLRKGAVTVATSAALSADRRTVSLTPVGALPDASELTVHATTSVTDVFGRHLAQPFSSRFFTVDVSAPFVAVVAPAGGAIQVPPGPPVVSLTFNEPLGPGTPYASLVQLSGPDGPVAGTSAAVPPAGASFTPSAPLSINATYTVTANGAVDASGNTQTVPFTSSFKTTDTFPPALTLAQPTAGAWLRALRPSVVVGVDDGTGSGGDPATALLQLDGAAVPATAGPTSIAHAPAADLAQGLHAVTAQMADRGGNVGALSSTSFGIDTVAPEAASVTGPAQGQVVSGTIALGGSAVDPGGAAASGIARVDLFRDGIQFLSLVPPFSQPFNTAGLPEGPHVLTARATDVAGNVGPQGPALTVIVNNVVLSIAITSPAVNTPFRDSVTVTALASEPVDRIEFAVGAALVVDDTAPYAAVLDLASVPEGPAVVTATAYAPDGTSAGAVVTIVVDRTAPAAPDATRITAEDTGDDSALVMGQPAAVEPRARVEATNVGRGVTISALAASDGSFGLRVPGAIGETLSIVAVDAAGNRSPAIVETVEQGLAQGDVPLTGLRLWVKANAGVVHTDNVVTSWQDQNPNGTNNHLLGSASGRPTLVTGGPNGPAVRFDGVDDFLAFTNRLTTIRTVFWVLKRNPGAQRMLLGDSSEYHFHRGGSVFWSGSASAFVREGQMTVNGAAVDGTTTGEPEGTAVISLVTNGNVAASEFSRDRSAAGSSWSGDLSELIIYDRPLSGAERKKVEDYLALKYAAYTPEVAKPSIAPDGGAFQGSTTVTLATSTPGAQIRYTRNGEEPDADSDLYTVPFTIDETTTVKARAFREPFPASDVAVATFVRAGDVAPGAFPGLKLWLRADSGVVADSAGRVSAWLDQSGNANHAAQAASQRQPLWTIDPESALPKLAFDGNDVLRFTRLTTVRTVFWVVRADAASVGQARALLGDSSEYHFHPATNALYSGFAHPAVANGQTRIDGVPVNGSSTQRPTTTSVISLVTSANVVADSFSQDRTDLATTWRGDLAELVIYDRPLNAYERAAVEAYLQAKYAVHAAVAAPVISPDGGTFSGPLDVGMTVPTPGATIHYTLDGQEPTLDSETYEGTLELPLTEATTLKAKAFKEGFTPSPTVTVGFTPAGPSHPGTVPGLKLWWRADAGVPSGSGDFWKDQSGNGNHGWQAASGLTPRLVPNAQNGLPVMQFDASDVVRFSQRLTAIRSVFWVVRADAANVGQARALLGDVSEYHFHPATNALYSGFAHPAVANGQTRFDGVPVNGSSTQRPTAMSVISLVTTGNVVADSFSQDRTDPLTSWRGDLAELLIYDRPLTAYERREVEAYLQAKYAVHATVTAPVISPDGGTFTGPLDVGMSVATPGATIHYTLDRQEPTQDSATYEGTPIQLPLTAATTVKAKAFKDGFTPSPTTTIGFTPAGSFHPGAVSGLALWWRTDAGVPSAAGDFWKDQSGQGNHGGQAASGLTPRLVPNAQNGLPLMQFDASDVVRFSERLTSIRTVFWVLRADAANVGQARALLGDTSEYHFHPASNALYSGSASPFVRSGDTRVNGTLVNGSVTQRPTATSVISLTTDGNCVASAFSQDRTDLASSWRGDVAELLIYDRELTATEVQAVENYLANRYAIALPFQ